MTHPGSGARHPEQLAYAFVIQEPVAHSPPLPTQGQAVEVAAVFRGQAADERRAPLGPEAVALAGAAR